MIHNVIDIWFFLKKKKSRIQKCVTPSIISMETISVKVGEEGSEFS